MFEKKREMIGKILKLSFQLRFYVGEIYNKG